MRPLTDQTILLTGATDGLGRACALDLAARGATLLLHGRDDSRGQALLREVRTATGNDRLHWYRADLASLDQVRELGHTVTAGHDRLDALISNAGIGATVPGGGARQESADGHELRFAVNYLAGFALTRLLMPLLQASAPARVVSVSSAGQAALDFDNVMLTHGYDGSRAYCQSKLAQVMMTFDLAEELPADQATATCLHPATYMPTKIVASPVSSIADGVQATNRLVTDPALEGVTGRYYNGLREARADPQAYDDDSRSRLRRLSFQLTGLPNPAAAG